ncbi:MAG: hypothetical protein J6W29_09475, partial [Neisseriaceae bacterium]|nr:hypothetical protein [Neisseriaceae bacterium]
MKKCIYKQIKKIIPNGAPNIGNGNNGIQNITLQPDDNVIVLPVSCSISGNLNLIERRLIFTDVSSGVYELVVHHKNETWKLNRKKVWACIRLYETENTELTANRIGSNFSLQYGCFKYCGGDY